MKYQARDKAFVLLADGTLFLENLSVSLDQLLVKSVSTQG